MSLFASVITGSKGTAGSRHPPAPSGGSDAAVSKRDVSEDASNEEQSSPKRTRHEPHSTGSPSMYSPPAAVSAPAAAAAGGPYVFQGVPMTPMTGDETVFFDMSRLFFAPVQITFDIQAALCWPTVKEVQDSGFEPIPQSVISSVMVRDRLRASLPSWQFHSRQSMTFMEHKFVEKRSKVAYGGQGTVFFGTLDGKPTAAKFIPIPNDALFRDAMNEVLMHSILCENDVDRVNVAKIAPIMGVAKVIGFPRKTERPMEHLVVFTQPIEKTLWSVVRKSDTPVDARTSTLALSLYQVCRLLHRLQREFMFVHRDLKIDNLMIQLSSSQCLETYMIDFGLARMTYREREITTYKFFRNRKMNAFNPYTDLRMLAWSSFGFDGCTFKAIRGTETCTGFDELLLRILRQILSIRVEAESGSGEEELGYDFPYNQLSVSLYSLFIQHPHGMSVAQVANALVGFLRGIVRRTECSILDAITD